MSDHQVSLLFDQEPSQRLDKYLAERLPDLSRSRLQTLIKNGMVSVDGKPATKAGQVLDGSRRILVRIPPASPARLAPEDIPLDVIFENEHVMVINKPAGMVVHPAAGHDSGTLVHAALAHDPLLEGIGGEKRPGVVHRLDKDTSGLILLAKNDQAHRWLQDQFRLRKVTKLYLALVDGHPPTPSGRVEAPVGRDLQKRKQMAIVPAERGREAVSEYRTLETFPEHTYLEVHPITGRTHQIRLHMAFLGCPVTGDTTYGRKRPTIPLQRHFLHAASLTIGLPGEVKPRTFNAPLPPELSQVLADLRRRG